MDMNGTARKLNFIDLFAGAGGLSEGFIQAGFNAVAHVEMNEFAAKTLETRMAYHALKENNRLSHYYDYVKGKIKRDEFIEGISRALRQTVICETMSDETLPGIFSTVDGIMKLRGIDHIDVIIGGPPCQAYSLVGRAQSHHMKVAMDQDPRNHLYKLYVAFLKRYKPRMFVFENVPGIKTAGAGETYKSIQSYLEEAGYNIEAHEQNAKDFGVLQSRRRFIIIGWRKGTDLHYPQFDKKEANAVVNDLFADLPALQPGGHAERYAKTEMSCYVRESGIRTEDDVLTHHRSRPNKDRDVEIYKLAIKLWNDGHKRLNYEKLQSGDIPAVRTGKTWRIKRIEFDEILTGRSKE